MISLLLRQLLGRRGRFFAPSFFFRRRRHCRQCHRRRHATSRVCESVAISDRNSHRDSMHGEHGESGQSATFSHAWQRCEKKYKNRKEQCTQRCTLYTGFVTVLAIYTSEQGGENPGFDPRSKPQILLRFHFPTYIKSSTSASKHPLADGVSYFRAGNRMFQESGPAHLT